MKKLVFLTAICSIVFLVQCTNAQNKKAMADQKNNPYYSRTDTAILNVSDADWKNILSKEVYNIARLKGTEFAFSGKYYKTDIKGMYYCAVCGNPLFRSGAKFGQPRQSPRGSSAPPTWLPASRHKRRPAPYGRASRLGLP